MNRRDYLLNGIATTAVLGVASFAGIATLVSCGANVLTWVGIVINAFTEAIPILQSFLPNSLPILQKALQVAKDLQAALKNAAPNAIDFLNQLITPDGLFNQIINDLGAISDQNQRRILAGILALAGVALRLIATGLHQGATQTKQGPEILSKARIKNPAGVSQVEKLAVQDTLEKALAILKF